MMKAVGGAKELRPVSYFGSAAKGVLGADRLTFVGELYGYPLWRYGPPSTPLRLPGRPRRLSIQQVPQGARTNAPCEELSPEERPAALHGDDARSRFNLSGAVARLERVAVPRALRYHRGQSSILPCVERSELARGG